MKKFVFAMMYFGAVAAWAADPSCGERGTNAYKFEWIPKDQRDSRVGSVIVINSLTGQTIQVLSDLQNYHGDNSSLRIEDLNNDGCDDLAVLNDVAPIGNETSTVFLYDRARKQFVYSEELSGIGGLDIDPQNKNCVLGFWKDGAAEIYTSQHCWSNGKLFIKRENSVYPMISKGGAVKCYMHTETTYKNGKKKTKKTCTAEL